MREDVLAAISALSADVMLREFGEAFAWKSFVIRGIL